MNRLHPECRLWICGLGSFLLVICFVNVSCVLVQRSPSGSPPVAADDLRGKVIVGYQGWFDCPGDDPLNPNGWGHWFRGAPDPANLHADLLPSVGEYDPTGLCATHMKRRGDGAVISLFTPLNAKVVKTHFRWMAENNIDGVAVQRFVNGVTSNSLRSHDDKVLDNVRAAAETYGRVFYVTYDVSGANPETVFNDIRNDWKHLVNDRRVTSSSSYLRYKGKPVLELWGFGFAGDKCPADPAQATILLTDLKNGAAGMQAVTLIGGVPAYWRTLDEDSANDPRWATVYQTYDVLSPWTVGRFFDAPSADEFLQTLVIPDLAETKRLGIDYMPVIFPGYSFHNASLMGDVGGWTLPLNQIPRSCGKFYWRQICNLLSTHTDMLYAAMFDEVDEGTALFKTAPHQNDLPSGVDMVALDQDGCNLPNDWYLRLTGQASAYLKAGQAPPASPAVALKP
jgi:hypothetical protein